MDARTTLDAAQRTRYARHLLLPEIGLDGQRRLAAARVLVVGAGGLGSPALLYLAAAGVGTLGIADDDTVDLTNLPRQIAYGTADLGRPKVVTAAEAVARLNPDVRVETHAGRVTHDSAAGLVAAYDVVVDGTDTFETRYLLGEACARAGVPHVWASVLRFDAQVSVWWAHHGPCYRCVFPSEPAADAVPSCAEAGVLGALVGTIGCIQAVEALKLVLGIGEPLIGRLLVHDGLRQSWDTLPVTADPECPVCGMPALSAQAADAHAGPAQIPVTEDSATHPPVPSVSARDLAAELRRPHPPLVIDVRSAPERAIVSVPGSVAVELADLRSGIAFSRRELGTPAQPLVFVCKTGIRSADATRHAMAAGWRYAANLEGGVLAWVRDVDPSQATY
ncbi:MAG: molybdopterin-synthase adenylyltransferase MoeB [Candidatus Phosphoribacter sp.]